MTFKLAVLRAKMNRVRKLIKIKKNRQFEGAIINNTTAGQAERLANRQRKEASKAFQ